MRRAPRLLGDVDGASRPSRSRVVVVRVPHFDCPARGCSTSTSSREYLRVFLLGVVALLGIFYISTFIDLVDKLFRGEATTGDAAPLLLLQTPQFVYYVIPMGVSSRRWSRSA